MRQKYKNAGTKSTREPLENLGYENIHDALEQLCNLNLTSQKIPSIIIQDINLNTPTKNCTGCCLIKV